MKTRNICILMGSLFLIFIALVFVFQKSNQLAKEKSEYESLQKKDEALKAKREIEKVEYEKDEAERLANWKANFPYKPIYHPTMKANPNIYPNENGDVTNEDLRLLGTFIQKHGFLKDLYENPLRFSRQFEELHSILAEYDIAGNPCIVGQIFQNTRDYHFTQQFDPDTLWHGPDLSKGEYNPRTGETEYEPKPIDGKTTWGQRAKTMADGIVAEIIRERFWTTGITSPSSEGEAQEIKDRILAEIDGWEETEGYPIIARNGTYEEELKEGDRLLIAYEGFVEDHRAYQKKTYNWEPPKGHP